MQGMHGIYTARTEMNSVTNQAALRPITTRFHLQKLVQDFGKKLNQSGQTQGGANERASNAHGVASALSVGKAGVYLLLGHFSNPFRKDKVTDHAYHEIESDQQACLVNCFTNKMSLSEGQPTADLG